MANLQGLEKAPIASFKTEQREAADPTLADRCGRDRQRST